MDSNHFRSLQAKEYHFLHKIFFHEPEVLLIRLKAINNIHFLVPNISLTLMIIKI